MADELDLGLEEEMALEEETAQEGTPVDPQEPPVQPMEMAPEGQKTWPKEGQVTWPMEGQAKKSQKE